MRALRVLPFLALTMCGNPEPIKPGGTATGNGGGGGGHETSCTNGADDDSDGLLDCEDSDCADDPACIESVCDDGVDDDLDGFVDCADADCWGHGCAVTMARITASGPATWTVTDLTLQAGGGCSNQYLDTAEVSLASPVGKLAIMTSASTAWTTCDWSADRSFIKALQDTSPFQDPVVLLREGFTVDADCPIQNGIALPKVVLLTNEGDWGLRTTAGLGPPWFGFGASPDVHNSVNLDDNNPIPIGGCNYYKRGNRDYQTWNTPDVSFEFVLTGKLPDTYTSGGTTGP